MWESKESLSNGKIYTYIATHLYLSTVYGQGLKYRHINWVALEFEIIWYQQIHNRMYFLEQNMFLKRDKWLRNKKK